MVIAEHATDLLSARDSKPFGRRARVRVRAKGPLLAGLATSLEGAGNRPHPPHQPRPLGATPGYEQ